MVKEPLLPPRPITGTKITCRRMADRHLWNVRYDVPAKTSCAECIIREIRRFNKYN